MPIAVLCPDRPVFQGRGASAGHLDVNSAAPQASQCHPSWYLASGSRHWLPRAYCTRDHEGMVCLLIKRTGRPGSRSHWSPQAHPLPPRYGILEDTAHLGSNFFSYGTDAGTVALGTVFLTILLPGDPYHQHS